MKFIYKNKSLIRKFLAHSYFVEYLFIYFLSIISKKGLLITSTDDRVLNEDIASSGNVNAIGVRTMTRRRDHKIQSLHVFAFLNPHMHLLCVFQPNVSYHQVVAFHKRYRLPIYSIYINH